MSRIHSHSSHETTRKKLLLTIVINVVITTSQLIGGLVSMSLSLLSDALHNLSDVFAVLVSYFGFRLSEFESSEKRTFGLKRAEVFAALINAIVLVLLSFFLFREAFSRILNPIRINENVVVGVGLIGLIGNVISMYLLYEREEKSLNIYSAFLHMAADALSSIAVISGAIIMKLTGFYYIDPLLTFFIGAYVLIGSYRLLSESIKILMQVVPEHIDIYKVKKAIESIEGIKNVHHIHLWSLTDKDIFFEAHVESVDDIKLSEACKKIGEIENLLKDKFGINHITVQMEFEACKDKSIIKSRKKL
ncbi:MAG: cation diffusion facilitator family transporter [Actinobacteria bacterium]|nr:cation diffusion facilitator family transporter [Actinomycetota bacterium]